MLPLPVNPMTRGTRRAELIWTSVYAGMFTLRLSESVLYAFATIIKPEYSITEYWAFSEWLINYQAGFIRRGLPGELIFQASHAVGLDARVVLFTLPLVILTILTAYLWRRFEGILPKWLIFSPVLLLFPVSDTWTLFRKDLTICLGTSLFLRLMLSRSRKSLLAANIIAILCLLTHEAFLPLFAGAIVTGCAIQMISAKPTNSSLSYAESKQILRLSITRAWKDFWPVVFASAMVITFRGDQDTANGIITSLGTLSEFRNIDLPVSAAIEALAWQPTTIYKLFTQMLTRSDHGIPVFLGVASTALGGIALIMIAVATYPTKLPAAYKKWETENARRFAFIATLIFTATLPLYYLGIDYGRWIFFGLFTSCVMYAEASVHSNFTVAPPPAAPAPAPAPKWQRETILASYIRSSISPGLMLIYGICPVGWELKTALGLSPWFWLKRHLITFTALQ